MTIHNVKFVPELSVNLLSVSQMAKKGKRIVFENNLCQIFDQNRNLIAEATMVNDLYQLNGSANTNPNKSDIALATTTTNSDIWHRRMGHICRNYLINVKNSTTGVTFNPSDLISKCKVCAMGKHSRAPFKDSGTRAGDLSIPMCVARCL